MRERQGKREGGREGEGGEGEGEGERDRGDNDALRDRERGMRRIDFNCLKDKASDPRII